MAIKKKQPKLRMTKMPTRDLKPYINNTKLHPMKQVKQLMKSINEFGFLIPILIDEHTKTIIAGHGRLQAAEQLGLTEVPVTMASHLTEAQIRAFNIADNQLTMNTGFDMEMLEKELIELGAEGMDLTLTGFTKTELSDNFGRDLLDNSIATDDGGDDGDEERGGGIWEHNPLFATCGQHMLYPSDNEWGIPTLDVEFQARYIDHPVQIWGSVGRNKLRGTVMCYSEDWRFENLWDNPHLLVNSGATMAIEPNFTVVDQQPMVAALWNTFRKRLIARYWQSFEIPIIVDTFTGMQYFETNLIGVPEGWRAYATRAQDIDSLEEVYERCLAHSKVKSLNVFLVYGGGYKHADLCKKRGWVHQLEHMQAAELATGRDYEKDRAIELEEEPPTIKKRKKKKKKKH